MRTAVVAALAAVLALGVQSAAAAAPEHLVVSSLAGGWKQITNKSGAQGFIHEQVPGNHAATDYSDIVTDQGFVANRGADPADFLRNIFANVGAACIGAKVNGPTSKLEGGYRVAYGQVRCGTQRGQSFGVHIFYKAISGDTALYSVSRSTQVPASADGDLLAFPKSQAAQAAALMKSEAATDQWLVAKVYLCGARSTDPRCR